MSSPSDQQLIQFIGQGRREALATLFDRYSADLYDYLARLAGDRDQAARLLDTVFMRVPGAAPGFQARDSVRGWLYSISREAGLDWLRQRGWLDGLPPSDEAIAPGLVGDVWKAARAMPAFFRAVLITEELQPLSPTEKARALGVNRTDLQRLIDEARRSFNRIYDAQARAEGRPTSDRIDPDTVWNARRRLPVEGGSLFGFLPPVPLPDSLRDQIRRHVVEALAPPTTRQVITDSNADAEAAAAAAGAAAAAALAANPPPLLPPPAQTPPVEPPTRRALTPPPQYPQPPRDNASGLGPISVIALPALIGVALALLLCAGVYLFTQNRSKPVITSLQPANGSTIQQTPEINVYAVFNSSRDIDHTKSTMQVDGLAVVPHFVDNSIAWSGPLTPGSHNAAVLLLDTAGNSVTQSWAFFVVAQGTPIPTPSGLPPITPLATVTPIIPVTSEIVTVTPILLTATPPPFSTLTPPPTYIYPTATTYYPPPTYFPPPTQCNLGGITGITFNDLNQNGYRDAGEPGIGGVVVNLANLSNSVIAVSVSDAYGNYRFNNIAFGQYNVQAVTPSGWFPTTTTSIPVNVFGCGTVSGFNFGFAQSAPVITPTFTPITPPFAVTNVSAFVTPTNSTTCPQSFTFSGTITTNGAGTVTYQWVRSDGTVTPAQNLYFSGAGTQNVVPPPPWYFPGPGPFSLIGWAQLQVLSPNVVSSPQAQFQLSCSPTATNTPITPIIVTATFTPTPPTPTNTPTPPTPPTPTDTPTPTIPPTNTNTPVPPFAVLSANAAVTPTSSTTCPENFMFSGDITVTGTGNVTYQWVRSDSTSGPPQVLTFLAPGTQPVATDTWTFPGPGPIVVSGWAKVHVISPNTLDSPQANFMLNCP